MLPDATPLLEEERHILFSTLTLNVDRPLFSHWSGVGPAFAADYDPVNARQVNLPDVLEQGFDRKEANCRRRCTERVDSREAVPPVLDTHAKPDMNQISHPVQLGPEKTPHANVALCEDLIGVPVGAPHYVTNRGDVRGRHVLVEQVAHRVDEYSARPTPTKRFVEFLGDETQVEALLEGMARHTPETFRECLRVAELAARADLGAPTDRVPGSVGPLDAGAVAHAERR